MGTRSAEIYLPLGGAQHRNGIGRIESISTWLAALLFTVAIVSLRPLAPADTAMNFEFVRAGDPLAQVGYAGLAVVSVLAALCLADRRRVMVLFDPMLILMLCFVGFGCLIANDPAASARAALYTLAAMTMVAGVLVLPADGDSMATATRAMCLAVLALNYAAVILLPGQAIHSAAEIQSEHVGLWRGAFTHKNTAGPAMACIAIAGLYILRRGWVWSGLAITAGAMLFTLKTGSKTTLGLVPVAFIIVVLPSILGIRIATITAFLITLVVMAFCTMGVVFIPEVGRLANLYFPDVTFTGRIDIWKLGAELISRSPWIGYGFDNVWTTSVIINNHPPFDADWDVRGAGHAHNGYMDIVLAMGLPALVVFVLAFIAAPARNYLNIPWRRESVLLGDMFMMILLFTMMNSFLESFFFKRADPIWMFVVFSVLGLRTVSRIPIETSRGRKLPPRNASYD